MNAAFQPVLTPKKQTCDAQVMPSLGAVALGGDSGLASIQEQVASAAKKVQGKWNVGTDSRATLNMDRIRDICWFTRSQRASHFLLGEPGITEPRAWRDKRSDGHCEPVRSTGVILVGLAGGNPASPTI